MPIDKEEVREHDSSRSHPPYGKAAWGLVVIFVASLALSFLAGIWTYYIVEFFLKGWHLLAG